VRVVISDGNGTVYEEGEAVQSELDGLMWTYTTTTIVPMTPAPRLDASAQDLPGNVGAKALQMN
jgi:hypothetical protein